MSNLTKYKILAFIRYAAEAMFFPYISLYLSNVGLKTSLIGIIIALIPVTGLVCNPIYAHFCKNMKITKRALTIMSAIEAICIVLLLLNNSFWYSLLFIILISIFSSSNYGLIDSLLTQAAIQSGKSFSVVRVFGSTSYMIFAFLAGYIAKWTSYKVLFIIAAIMFVLTTIIYLFTSAPEDSIEIEQNSSFRDIFKNKIYMLYLLFYVLLIGTMQVADDYFSLYITSKGAPDYYYSYVMLGFILVEIITLNILNHLKRRPSIKLYFLAAALMIVRLIVQSLPFVNYYVLIALQLTRGVTWAIALYLSTQYVTSVLGNRLATKGIMLIVMVNQIYTSAFKLAGGYIIESIDYPRFYMILSILSVIAFVYWALIYKVLTKKSVD